MRKKRYITVERLREIARNAIAGGYAVQETSPDKGTFRQVVTLIRKHDCDNPYGYELYSRWSSQHDKKVLPLIVRGTARCRKCGPCKKMRSRFWQGKAVAEFSMWPCTMMGTLTLTPREHFLMDAHIASALHKKGVNINDLSVQELFTHRCVMMTEFVQQWLKILRHGRDKRLRRGAHGPVRRPKIRYLLVAEMHDSAETSLEMRHRPHFHILVHDVNGGALTLGSPVDVLQGLDVSGEWQLRWRKDHKGKWQRTACLSDDAFIRKKWEHGFTNFVFASDARSASYLCKYLTKSFATRVIASQNYGNGPKDIPHTSESEVETKQEEE